MNYNRIEKHTGIKSNTEVEVQLLRRMDPVFELLQEGLLGIEPEGELGVGEQRGL